MDEPVPLDRRPPEVVVAALKALGGIAHLGEIAEQCKIMGHAQPEPSIRRLLQQFSSDATWIKARKPPSAPDLFYSLDGVEKRTGFWGLRNFSATAPDEYPIPGLSRAYPTLLQRSETPLGNTRGIAYKGGVVRAVQVSFAPDSPYPDRLLPDGRIEHIGEGRGRIQEDKAGNHGMLEALRKGLAVPVFQSLGPKGSKRYAPLDLYRVTGSEHRTLRFAGNDHDTDAFVFTLEPSSSPALSDAFLRAVAVNSEELPTNGQPNTATIQNVPVQTQHTERMIVRSRSETIDAERREHKLLRQFDDFLKERGLTTASNRLRPEGETNILVTDLYATELDLLVEAKGTTDRMAFRMAIGELADYRRLFPKVPRCAILLPSKPRPDLLKLAAIENLTVIWLSPDGFASTTHLW